jgi:hypothetical protein
MHLMDKARAAIGLPSMSGRIKLNQDGPRSARRPRNFSAVSALVDTFRSRHPTGTEAIGGASRRPRR